MENNVSTAKELFDKMLSENEETTSTEMMIEFAKLHCEAQLEAILENAKLDVKKKSQFGKSRKWQKVKDNEEVDLFSYEMQYFVDKNSIINAYNLNNIK